jgi:hypothetical protein
MIEFRFMGRSSFEVELVLLERPDASPSDCSLCLRLAVPQRVVAAIVTPQSARVNIAGEPAGRFLTSIFGNAIVFSINGSARLQDSSQSVLFSHAGNTPTRDGRKLAVA